MDDDSGESMEPCESMEPLSGNNLGQVVDTRVPLSPSCVIWYRRPVTVMPCGCEGNLIKPRRE